MEWASAVTILGFICICSSTASAECEPIVRGFTRDTRLEIHTNKIGVSECCEAINCDKGTQARFCEADDPTSTSCVPCEAGKFQPRVTKSSDMVECELHTHCDPDSSEVLTPGNATTDTVCICSLALGYHGDWSVCKKNKGCPAGSQHKLDGSCESCPINFYQATNSSLPCSPCTFCDTKTQEVELLCTKSSNTVCRNITEVISPWQQHENSSDLNTGIAVPIIIAVLLTTGVLVAASVVYFVIKRTWTTPQPSASSSGSNLSAEPQAPEEKRLLAHDVKEQQVKADEVQEMQQKNINNNDHTPFMDRSSLCTYDGQQGQCRCPRSDEDAASENPSADFGFSLQEDSFRYVVETEPRPGSVYDQPQHCTRMNGKINAKNGNVYVIKNCQNVQVGL